MKLKVSAAVLLIGIAFLIGFSQLRSNPLAPAEDFPRDALIYVQIADLPGLIKFWNESKFKSAYLESENFQKFQNSHLGLKLASRWKEFNDAAGFPVDLETLSGLTGTGASLAVYNIGKLEFVFIAPLSDELYAATGFVRNEDKFTEEELPDGTVIYRANVDADRGRQKQEIIFTHVKGRLIVATSEKLLAQTLQNITGKMGRSSLADEPAFKLLSEKFALQTATVWVNQTALNNDYYFKHYWLMSGIKDLKNIRAGIFDFSIAEEGKLIERRKFLLNQPLDKHLIGKEAAEKSLALLPAAIPFYHLQAPDRESLENAVYETIFERQKIPAQAAGHYRYYPYEEFEDAGEEDYSSLGEKFDEAIDDPENDETVSQSSTVKIDFAVILQSAGPEAVLTFTEPKALPAPLFAEFDRAAVLILANPASFDHNSFEAAIEKSFLAQTAISAPGVDLKWETKDDNNISWREINLPMTGWKAAYAVRGTTLILANDSAFLQKIISSPKQAAASNLNFPLADLKVIDLAQKETAFDQVFGQLNEKGNEEENSFFTGNISSLIDSAAGIKTVEVSRNYTGNFLTEETVINF